ncbi:MAG: uracil-DNA glycosylase [Deinococcaceae bacterium]
MDLNTLKQQAEQCTSCDLCKTRTHVVFGEGNPHPKLVFVGEGPGGEEDITGRPFVGRAGQLLDKIMLAAGIPRESVYICNMVKCRPPGNRNPEPQEIAACAQWLTPQLELLCPSVVVTLGNIPTQHLLATKQGITRMRGTWHERTFAWGHVWMMPMFHPAYLLRNDSRAVGGPKSLTWRDIREVKAVLEGKAVDGVSPSKQDTARLF